MVAVQCAPMHRPSSSSTAHGRRAPLCPFGEPRRAHSLVTRALATPPTTCPRPCCATAPRACRSSAACPRQARAAPPRWQGRGLRPPARSRTAAALWRRARRRRQVGWTAAARAPRSALSRHGISFRRLSSPGSTALPGRTAAGLLQRLRGLPAACMRPPVSRRAGMIKLRTAGTRRVPLSAPSTPLGAKGARQSTPGAPPRSWAAGGPHVQARHPSARYAQSMTQGPSRMRSELHRPARLPPGLRRLLPGAVPLSLACRLRTAAPTAGPLP